MRFSAVPRLGRGTEQSNVCECHAIPVVAQTEQGHGETLLSKLPRKIHEQSSIRRRIDSVVSLSHVPAKAQAKPPTESKQIRPNSQGTKADGFAAGPFLENPKIIKISMCARTYYFR
jgi:hypothetical protein